VDVSAEELFEDAPCGYLTTRPDGVILKVNRTFERLTGLTREQLIGQRRFQDLLAPGGRIYYETHYAPLLHMQGSVREVATELIRADGSRLPALIGSSVRRDSTSEPDLIRTIVFEAADRRRFEQELVQAQQREHETAHRLQQSMLTAAIPAAPTFTIEIAYRSGVRDLEVGGDWYDAFWLDEPDRVALVVGDVVGKGLDAASTMGQLRSAVRSYALTVRGPGELLDALDHYARHHHQGRLATLIYADLDLRTRQLRYAAAGHPPPILLTDGQAPVVLWDGRSTPLDAGDPQPSPRSEAHHTLEPAGGLILYTDGLIERRTQTFDHGLQQLLHATRTHQRSRKHLAHAILQDLRPDRHPDDTCVLALHLVSQRWYFTPSTPPRTTAAERDR
jgi:phosphoserine phosphatase RsbU/P